MPALRPERNDQFEAIGDALKVCRSDRERKELLTLLEELEWECVLEDPWYFLRTMAKTRDEHDLKSTYKHFPDLPHLREISYAFESEDMLALVKSRQMMISWLMVALCLWWGMKHTGQLIFFQSKKEEDALKLVERAWGIYERLPAYVQKLVPAEQRYLKIIFPGRDTRIEGIPQGADQIRSNTPSIILSDEMAFQEEAGAAYAAALPAVQAVGERKGKIILVSSAAPGVFAQLVADET